MRRRVAVVGGVNFARTGKSTFYDFFNAFLNLYRHARHIYARMRKHCVRRRNNGTKTLV